MVEISDAASDTFTVGETRVLVDCAYFAGSGLVRDAAVEILASYKASFTRMPPRSWRGTRWLASTSCSATPRTTQ